MIGKKTIYAFVAYLILHAILAGSIGVTKVTFADRGEKFYYFNPDSPQSNMSRLKLEMDKFLKQSDFVLSFTPFARFSDFDRLNRLVPPNFILLPHWYLEENSAEMKFVPLLVPTRNNSTSYRKLLLTPKKSTVTLENLSKRTLATTFTGKDANARLNKLLFSQHNLSVDNMNIVVTPKDSDALFALALGQVEMALVSEENLNNISKVNPVITQSVRALTESGPISLPILCYREGVVSKRKVAEIKSLFLKSERTATIMEILQFDGWQEYSN